MIWASFMAFWIGVGSAPGGPISMPKPMRKVSRSRKVTGRLAGTTSSIGPSMLLSTLRSAISGSSRSTGSSRRSLPSSTRIIAATAVIGLVMDAIRKMLSRFRGVPRSRSCMPTTSTWVSPRRSIRVMAPATSPLST